MKEVSIDSSKNPFSKVMITLWILGVLSIFMAIYYFPKELTGISISTGSSSSGIIMFLTCLTILLFSYVIWSHLTFKYRAHLYSEAFDRKINDEKLKAINNAKFSSIANLAAGIAHEVNNPLAIISCIEQHIRSKLSKNPNYSPKESDLDKIYRQVNRISQITKSLKDMMINHNPESFATVSAKTIVEQTYDLLRSNFEVNGVKFTIKKMEEYQDEFKCIPTDISQVVFNLLNNSLESVIKAKEKWVEITILELTNGVRIKFTDSGKKPSNDLIQKIFDPFFSTKDIDSVGMGLTISLSIAKAHKGHLEFNALDPHTCFELDLPYDPAVEVN